MSNGNKWTELKYGFEYHGMCVVHGKWDGKPGIGLCYGNGNKNGFLRDAPLLLQKPFADVIEAMVAMIEVAKTTES